MSNARDSRRQHYLRDTDLAERYGVARQTIWRWVRQGFPAPIKITSGCSRWDLTAIEAYEAERSGER